MNSNKIKRNDIKEILARPVRNTGQIDEMYKCWHNVSLILNTQYAILLNVCVCANGVISNTYVFCLDVATSML